MADIQRVAGNVPTRCWGSAYKDLVWAVGVSDDFDLAFREQAVRAFANLDKVLAETGTDKTRILSATVILADMDDKPVLDELWADWVDDDPQAWPQRACHGGSLAPKVLIEILTVAVREDPEVRQSR